MVPRLKRPDCNFLDLYLKKGVGQTIEVYNMESHKAYLAAVSTPKHYPGACGGKRDSIENNHTGWSDHKLLTGQVMVGSHAPGILLL